MLAPTPTSHDALVAHLERLDAAAVVAHLQEAIGRGATLDQVIVTELWPAWEDVAARCDSGELDRATAGAVAAVARRALAGASRLAPGRPVAAASSSPVVVVSPAGSPDGFAAEVIGELAAAKGWSVEQLGGSRPAEELSAYAGARRPAAVIVTAHDPVALPALLGVVHAAHASGAPVLAWGRAFGITDRRSRALGVDTWAPRTDVALGVLDVWRRSSPLPTANATLPDAHAEVDRLRPALLGAAGGAGGEDDVAAEWARRSGSTLVDHLAAAVALVDPSILSEHLERERRSLGRTGFHDVHLVGLIDAVAAALPLTSVVAREYIFTSREDLRRALMGAPKVVRSDPEPRPAGGAEADGPAAPSAGQAFADILLLAALACQTPFALLSVPQANGAWSTLSYGFEQRNNLNEPRLFELVAGQPEPVEIADLAAHPELGRSAFAQPPHSLRWVYAVALRGPGGQVLGVVAVMDRWLRELSRREQRAMQAAARQATAQLTQIRKGPATPAPAAPTPPTGWSQPPVPAPAPAAPKPDPLAGLRRPVSLQDGQQLLRSHEVAVLFDVTERTVINWAAAGKLPSLRTIGGHLRFRSEDVLELLAGRSSGG